MPWLIQTCVLACCLVEGSIQLGDPIPSFENLPSADGSAVSLSAFEKRDILVVTVTCNECPVAQSYEPRFAAFVANFCKGDKADVAFLSINPYDRPGDTLEDMTRRAKEAKFEFPYAQDKSQSLSKALGAEKTPHVFVFDKSRKLVYKGAFDDSWIDPESVKRRYVEEVVTALRAGKKIESPTTKPEGCGIQWD